MCVEFLGLEAIQHEKIMHYVINMFKQLTWTCGEQQTYIEPLTVDWGSEWVKWIDPKEFGLNKYTSDSSKGCVLEVDLEYPK